MNNLQRLTKAIKTKKKREEKEKRKSNKAFSKKLKKYLTN